MAFTSARVSASLMACVLACLGATVGAAQQHAERQSPNAPPTAAPREQISRRGFRSDATPLPPPPSDPRYHDVIGERTQRAAGLYITGPFLRVHGARGVIQAVRGARLDAAVIDVKDGGGRVWYSTQIPELQAQRFGRTMNMADEVRAIEAAGIYTIARIVCFADPRLPASVPDRAIQDARPGRGGRPWVSWGTGGTWLDPYNTRNHDMIVELAREAAALGFDEIQLDYIRWPVDDGIVYARYPSESTTLRRHVLLDLLRRIDEAVHVPLGVDVFGLTAFRPGDSDGLGQDIEAWTQYVDVFSPMLYVNAMKTWNRRVTQNRHGQLIHAGMETMRARVGDRPILRPFIQAFENGADYFNPQFIAEQVRGARTGGSDGFLFWHPGSVYGMVRQGMNGPGRGLLPFPIEHRLGARTSGTSAAQASSRR